MTKTDKGMTFSVVILILAAWHLSMLALYQFSPNFAFTIVFLHSFFWGAEICTMILND